MEGEGGGGVCGIQLNHYCQVCGILLNHLISIGSGLRLKITAATEAAPAPAVPTPLLIAVIF